MVRLQQPHLLLSLAVLLVAAGLAAGWCLRGSRRMVQAASLDLALKRRESRRMAALDPPATETQAAAIEAELARAESTLAASRQDLWTAAPGAFPAGSVGAPVSRTDAFFGLMGFVKDLREQAERAGVSLRPEEQFGFSAYSHEGPPTGLIVAVQRQRQIAACLVEALFVAHPRQLLSVQRAPAASLVLGKSLARLPGGATLVGDADAFEFDPRLSIQDPGVTPDAAFRLTFTGYSATLRRFLNRLATCDLLLVVRGVDVEPVAPDAPPRKAPPHGAVPLAPAIAPRLSRFVVTVESCGLEPLPVFTDSARPAASRPAGSDAALRRWGEPVAQRRGFGWIYDVFTSPAVYFDERSRALTATPAPDLISGETDEVPLDLELLEVRREPSRLQLVGYAGGPEELRGIFLDVRTGETAIGHTGDRLAGGGWSVKRLWLAPASAGRGNGMETEEPLAVATVEDAATGNEIVLTSRGRSWSETLLALVANRRIPSFRRELREGESIALAGASYLVKRIDADPPLVVIADQAAGGAGTGVHALRPTRAPVTAAVAPALPSTGRSLPSLSNTP